MIITLQKLMPLYIIRELVFYNYNHVYIYFIIVVNGATGVLGAIIQYSSRLLYGLISIVHQS